MLLESVTFHEIGPFADWKLDLAKYGDAKLIALVADNGSGKTFTLESAFLGTCYREMATQGTLASRARARDSYIETTFVHGARWTVRHNVDAISKTRKGTSVVKREDGQPAYEGTSVSQFDAWAKRHLPQRDVLCCTQFAVQKSGGFLELGNADRMSVLLQTLRLAKLERYAEGARKHASAAETVCAELRSRIGDIRGGAWPMEEALQAVDSARTAREQAERELADARAALALAERAQQHRRELAAAEERVAEIQRGIRGGDVEAATFYLDRAVAARELAELELANATAELSRLREEADRIARLRVAYERAVERRSAVETALEGIQAEIVDTEQRLAGNRWIQGQAEQIRAHAADAARLTTEIAAAEAAQVAAGAAAKELARKQTELGAQATRLGERIARLEIAVRYRALAEAAFAELPELERAELAASDALADAEAELSELQGRRALGDGERIRGLRGGHQRVIAEPSQAVETAMEALAEDDAAVTLATELPGQLEAARAAVASAKASLEQARAKVTQTKERAAKLDGIEAAAKELESAQAELYATKGAAEEARAAKVAADANVGALTSALALQREALAVAQDGAKLLAKLEQSDGRIAELTPLLASHRAALAENEAALAAIELPEEPPPAPDASAAESTERAARDALDALRAAEVAARERLAAAEREAALNAEAQPRLDAALAELERLRACASCDEFTPEDEARSRFAAAEAALDAARAADVRAVSALEQSERADKRSAELETELAAAELELADWTRLALDCGRTGIQSAEIDSAGPELTELTNDLLHRCHGPRYTVSIETKRLSSDGRKEIDECRVMVIDTVDGTEKEAREHSGGETTILSEAVSLALTMMSCRRAGIRDISLIRDESGGPLSPANARAYVAMLRRAVDVIGARHVLLVSHDLAVQELCDVRINLPARERGAPNTNAATEAA
jgi:exonuclease SbcC